MCSLRRIRPTQAEGELLLRSRNILERVRGTPGVRFWQMIPFHIHFRQHMAVGIQDTAVQLLICHADGHHAEKSPPPLHSKKIAKNGTHNIKKKNGSAIFAGYGFGLLLVFASVVGILHAAD